MLIEIINSNFVQALTTLLVGAVAIILYWRQKVDYKKNVANSILLEIQGVEAVVAKVRDAVRNNNLDIDVSVLQSESWSKNKQLFVRNFNKDEWEAVSDFYNKAALLDEAIQYNKTAFASDIEQIRANKQRVFAVFAEELVNDFKDGDSPEKASELYALKAKAFDAIYMEKQDDFMYRPVKPVNDAKLYLQNFPKLTTNSVGVKLRKISGLNR